MELINLHAFQVLKLLNNNEITSEDYVTELLKHINKKRTFNWSLELFK